MSYKSVLLDVINVAKRYEGIGQTEGPLVLKNISFKVNTGDQLAITGPSGSGKSTLLNVIGTLDRPTSGQVLLGGRDLSRLNNNELPRFRSQRIGFIFQAHHLLPQCSVLENVLIPTLAMQPRPVGKDSNKKACQLLDRVDLSDRLSHRPGQLSGGERQRVAVVRALINEPELILADEPTGALDRSSADNLSELLVDLNQEEGVTLIVATHALGLASRMHRVMELVDGELVSKGAN